MSFSAILTKEQVDHDTGRVLSPRVFFGAVSGYGVCAWHYARHAGIVPREGVNPFPTSKNFLV